MRRQEYKMDEAQAWAMLTRAPWVRLATTTPDGEPLLRPLHAVISPGQVAFHGAPAGEKVLAVGQRAVIGWEEVIAEIPSYWTDPERACPATTFFLSVQAHGVIEEVEDMAQRAAVLEGLMQRYQPEGGYAPITADDPRYKPSLRNLLIVAVRPTRVEGKAKLGQNRKPAQLSPLVQRLWERGAPTDPRAVELVLAANPEVERPAFLRAPNGVTLHAHLDAAQQEQAATLLADTYWCAGLPRAALLSALRHSSAVIGASVDGQLVGCARGVSDYTRRAWVYDVFVDPSRRGAGIGEAMMRLLLDHPALRGAYHVRLGTRDAAAFYRRLGFTPTSARRAPYPVEEMILTRAAGAGR
jgi:ribosomal protein S18 acetylase RimI-like enzyme/nitroimidazol reductase NimA-like FMN-containing flavoprotein (pyridoxamine 5'-phosphate oxidase superfamily)